MKKIIVAGSLNMDMVIHTPYYPKSGETISGSGFMTNCGGKGANQATAAGDTLCGGLAAGLARGETLVEAMAFASKAASIACTRRGAAQSVPTYEEVAQYGR